MAQYRHAIDPEEVKRIVAESFALVYGFGDHGTEKRSEFEELRPAKTKVGAEVVEVAASGTRPLRPRDLSDQRSVRGLPAAGDPSGHSGGQTPMRPAATAAARKSPRRKKAAARKPGPRSPVRPLTADR